MGRSLKDLIETLNVLKDRGFDFISVTKTIDTTTPGGKLIFHLMEALAEFERDLTQLCIKGRVPEYAPRHLSPVLHYTEKTRLSCVTNIGSIRIKRSTHYVQAR